jgi:RNA polymerase sigma-70 factor, ECF subfamily
MELHGPKTTDADGSDVSSLATDRATLDALFSATYEELRRLAASVHRSHPHASLSPTALVNDAWLKIVGSPPAGIGSVLHFKRIAARAMRQVLVDAARRRAAEKHGGAAVFVTLEDGLSVMHSSAGDMLALNEALSHLAQLQPRQAEMVEVRFFGGLDVSETAALLEVSEATVLRDWRAARAWLAIELRRE